MQIFTSIKSKRVVYFTYVESTFLQSLEDVVIRQEHTPLPMGPLPEGMTRETTYCWTYESGKFTHLNNTDFDEEMLLNRKCALLHRVQYGVTKARYPFHKNLHSQEDVYDRKFWQCREYVNAKPEDREKVLALAYYVQDEAEIQGTDPLSAALEVMKRRSEREWALRASERGRRILTEKICQAKTFAELNEVAPHVVDQNFRLPMRTL